MATAPMEGPARHGAENTEPLDAAADPAVADPAKAGRRTAAAGEAAPGELRIAAIKPETIQ